MQVREEGTQRNADRVDVDGLPHVGAVVYPGQAYYSKADRATGAFSQRPLRAEQGPGLAVRQHADQQAVCERKKRI